MENRLKMQRAGDKSGELSVRTQDLIEEDESSEEEDNAEGESVDGDISDDDLSEQMSYDDNDNSAYNNTSSLGPLTDDEDIEESAADGELLFDESEEIGVPEVSEEDEVSVSVSGSGSESVSLGEDESQSQIEGGVEPDGIDIDGPQEEAPQDFSTNPMTEAAGTVQDLIDVYSSRSQVSCDQYKRSLRQLHSKWSGLMEQVLFDREEQLDRADQERQELEMLIEELRQEHEDELEETKVEVMEQSQRIILEEMKANADREIKNEESTEIAVQNAVEEATREMNEDFEISLSGMKAVQDEMKERYEKLVEETEIRVKDEVEADVKKRYKSKLASFKDQYGEMKKQLVEKTMQIQDLEMKAGEAGDSTSKEAEELIALQENEIEALRKSLEDMKEMHAKEVEKAKQQGSSSNNEDFEIALSGMKATQDENENAVDPKALEVAVLKARYETALELNAQFGATISKLKEERSKAFAETETRVRNEVHAEAQKEAGSDSKIDKQDYEKTKQQILEISAELEKVEVECETKTREIEGFGVEIDKKSKEIEELNDEVATKIKTISKLEEDMVTKSSSMDKQATDLNRKVKDIEGKDRLVKKLTIEIEKKENLIQLYDNELSSKIEELVGEITGRDAKIEKIEVEMEMKTKEVLILRSEMKEFKTDSDLQNAVKKLEGDIIDRNTKIRDLLEENESHVNIATDQSEVMKDLHIELENKDTCIEEMSAKLKAMEEKIEELQILVDKARKQDDQIAQMENAVSLQNQEMQTLVETLELEMKVLKEQYDDIVQNKKQLEVEHKTALKDVEARTEATAQIKPENEIKALIQREEETAGSSDDEVRVLRMKYDSKIRNLSNQLEEERKEKSGAIEKMTEEHTNGIAAAQASFDESMVILQRKHTFEVQDLKQAASEEQGSHAGILQGVEEDKQRLDTEHRRSISKLKESIFTLKRDYQTAIERLEEQHNRESAESLHLIGQLRVEKDTLMASVMSVSSGKSLSSSKMSIKRKNISSPTSKSKTVIEGPSLSSQLESIANGDDSESSPSKSRKVEEEAASCNSAGKTTVTSRSMVSRGVDTLASPGKKSPNKVLLDLSPLTMTSPLAKAKAINPAGQPSRGTGRVPHVVGTHRKSYKASSRTPSTEPRKSTRSKTNTLSQTRRIATTNRKPSRSSMKTASRGGAPMTPPRRSTRTDLNTVQKRSRHGLFSSLALSPLVPTCDSDVKLLVMNVPLSERMQKMARVLKIQFTDDAFSATHVIAGDSEHHMRRTAKLMAVLCITPNIVKAEWLYDSYKARYILSCNHHLLLNDRKAEKLYSFSMRNTIREGNDRRSEGGLLCGWKLLVCNDVAGNKAPKEADLRMMIKAAGGEWITASQIPLPVEDDPTHVIAITSDPATTYQLNDESAHVAAENGAGYYSISWLFDCMMHQKLLGIKRGLGRV